MDKIEGRRREVRPMGVPLHHLYVRQAALCRELAGKGDVDRVDIQPNDPARRTDPVGQQIQDPAGPAAQVDDPPALGDPNPVQQQLAVTAQLAGLTLEPVTFLGTAAQRVDNATCRVIP
jgi:hypothetical protein